MTAAEWNIFRFGKEMDAEIVRVVTAILTLLLTIGMIAYLVRGTTLFLGMLFPSIPSLECAAVLIGITALYTMCAGFYAVVFTDLVQGSIVMPSSFVVGAPERGMPLQALLTSDRLLLT